MGQAIIHFERLEEFLQGEPLSPLLDPAFNSDVQLRLTRHQMAQMRDDLNEILTR